MNPLQQMTRDALLEHYSDVYQELYGRMPNADFQYLSEADLISDTNHMLSILSREQEEAARIKACNEAILRLNQAMVAHYRKVS